MKKALRIFALLMAASMLFWLVGCGGDDDEEEETPDPEVTGTVPAAGAEVPGNAVITFNLNKAVDTATVTGAAGTTAVAGKAVTFTPTGDMPAGPVTLTLNATDKDGKDVSFTLSITAKAGDKVAPKLNGGACDPKDGADGVDPADYGEKLVIVFDESLAEAKVNKKEPEFNSVDELADDTLTMTFQKYSMPNETEFSVEILAKDLAGNEATLEYSFTTMSKEE